MATAREPERPQQESNSLPQALMAILGAAHEAGGKVWDSASHFADRGASELASVLYRGDAFVVYGHSQDTEKSQAGHEPSPATQQEVGSQQVEQPTQGAEL